MLGYYVIMVATLGMTVTAGMTILASASAGERLAQASRDTQALVQAETAVREALVYDAEGRVFAPAHQDDADGPALPQWVTSLNFAPSSGTPLGYCPYAPTAAPDADSLPEARVRGRKSDKDYRVRLRDRVAKGGQMRGYVEAGRRSDHPRDSAAAPEVLAFVVGPARGRPEIADCDQIYWDGRGWSVDTSDGGPDGVVRAISRETLAAGATAARQQVIRRTVARNAVGDGRDRDTPTSLERALSEWQALKPARMTIEFLPETDSTAAYSVPEEALESLGADDAGLGRSLHLVALPGDGAVQVRPTGPSGTFVDTVSLTASTDLTLEGIALPQVQLTVDPGVRVVLHDARLKQLVNGGGDIVVRGTTTIGTSDQKAAGVIARGGNITVTGDGTLIVDSHPDAPAALDLDGAQLRVDGQLRATEDATPLFAEDRSFLASYGATGKAVRGATDETGQSETRMRVSELSGLRYDTLASLACAGGGSDILCRRTANCAGLIVEPSCISDTSGLRLVSMQTLRTGAGEAHLECIWRNDQSDENAAKRNITATATATCLPIRLDGLATGPGG